MADTTTIRISRATHEELRQLAASSGRTVTDTVERAVRLLQEDTIGQDLREPLTDDEIAWLHADAG